MTDSAQSEEKISLKIKTTSNSYDVEVEAGATVADVKRVLVEKTGYPIERITLIFSGKILKDADTLAQHSIKDGMAIHLVIRTQPSTGSASAQSSGSAVRASPSPNSQPQPSPTNPFAALSSSGGGSPMDMLNNPEMMQQMMNSPIMQSLLSNPQVFRSLLTENPQIQQLIEANPELGHILNDPEMMRQTMEMIRNPNTFHEMMRNHDQAIRNLQGIPGGEAALQRLYQEVQEPLLNSATSSLAGNPFAALQNNSASPATSRSQNAGVENAEALPNPWGGPPRPSQPTEPAPASNGAPSLGGATGIPGMLGSPGMQSMMQQLMGDPQLIQQLMSPETVQSMQQMLASNPSLIQNVLRSNPLVAGNPQLEEEMRNALPQMLESANVGEMMRAMANPRVVEAMRQIQAGMEVLRREAPQLAGMFGGMRPPSGRPLGERAGGGSETAADSLSSLLGGMNVGGGVPVNPEERFASQLEQLQAMGFTNEAENIAALVASFGDVNGAIERLLQR